MKPLANLIAAAAQQAARHIGIPQCVQPATGIYGRPFTGKARAIAGVTPGAAATELRPRAEDVPVIMPGSTSLFSTSPVLGIALLRLGPAPFLGGEG